MSVMEKEDWKSVIDLVTNARQVVSSVQDVGRKLADYAKFTSKKSSSNGSIRKESHMAPTPPLRPTAAVKPTVILHKNEGAVCKIPEELFVPGTVYYLKRDVDNQMGGTQEYFSLWKRHPDEHFQRIVLSSNLISDHRCDSHHYALRDVLKGLPASSHEDIFT